MKPLTWLCCALAYGLASGAHASAGFLRAQGKFIGNDTGLVQLRGLGLGGWMLQEGYMIGTAGFAGTQHEVRSRLESVVGSARTEAFYQAWRDNFLTKEDVDSLASWGFNSLRLPMHWNLYMEPGLPVKWKEEGFRRTDSLLAWCKADKIWLILDLHAAPGGQGNDNNISDRDTSSPSLWQSPDNRTMAVALWKQLAERYKDETSIGGYDLLNETNWPFDGANRNGCDENTNAPLRQLMVDMTTAIRSVDAHHLVIMEGNCWGGNYNGIMPPWDSNMAISFHKYWNSTEAGTVNPLFALRDKYDTPIWCGESGENGNQWFRETLRMFEKEKIGWSWWPLKKIESVVGPVSVSTTPGWEAFLAWGNGKGAMPDSATLSKGLQELSDNLRLRKCRIQPDVIDAMFRQMRTDSTKPWREIHAPGAFGAQEFDLGADGFAYHDANSVRVDEAKTGDWNNGWSFRNDGADIQWSTEENTWNVGWIDSAEWMNYTVFADTAASFVMLARAAGPGGTFDLLADGNKVATMKTAPTAGWTTWTDNRTSAFPLAKGRHTLRLLATKSGYNLSKLGLALATAACVQDGNCPTSGNLSDARSRGAAFEATSSGLRLAADHATEVTLRDPKGRILVHRTLAPGETIPSRQLGGPGVLLLEWEGHLARFARP